MKKRQFLTPVLIGLLFGQVFAEGDSPFTVINTFRVGYDDNIDNRPDGEGSVFFRDMVDLSFRAAISDRTDLVFKSRWDYQSDEESNFNPNLYVVLTHSVSQRLLLQLSDKFRRDQVTSSRVGTQGRYDYYENKLSFNPSYVLSSKDRLSVPMSYTIERHEDALQAEDKDMASIGLSWRRDLSPQRTWAALNLHRTRVEYEYAGWTSDSTLLTAEISHTLNPEWQAEAEVGFSLDETDSSLSGTNKTSSAINPFLRLGLAYTPTPRTRFTGDFTHRYKESEHSTVYSGESSKEFRFGAQHDFTAKIMGKVTAMCRETERESKTSGPSGAGDTTEERFVLDCRVHYKLNRINFLELGFKHEEKHYESSDRDWDSNMIDLGWRVEL